MSRSSATTQMVVETHHVVVNRLAVSQGRTSRGLSWSTRPPKRARQWLIELKFYFPLDTEQVISQTFLPASLLA